DEREHAAVEEIIAHVNYIGLREEDYRVAVSVAGGKMNGANVFAVEVDRYIVFESDHRHSGLGRRRSCSNPACAACGQALTDVLLGDDWSFLAEVRIAAGVVAMPVCVEHEFYRLVGDALERGFDFIGQRQELVVDYHDAVFTD